MKEKHPFGKRSTYKNRRYPNLLSIKIPNWDFRDHCDDVQYYYRNLINDDMVACIITPHKYIDYKWLLRIGFSSTFNKWGDVEYENKFDTLDDVIKFMRNKNELENIKSEED